MSLRNLIGLFVILMIWQTLSWFNANNSYTIKKGFNKQQDIYYVENVSDLARLRISGHESILMATLMDTIRPKDNNSRPNSDSIRQPFEVEQINFNDMNTGVKRFKRRAKKIGINETVFLDMISDDLMKNATSYILDEMCVDLLVCNYVVSEAGIAVTDDTQCCMQCDCSPTCHVKMSCCPIVNPIDVPEIDYNTAGVCQYPMLFLNFTGNDNLDQNEEFYFIASCPIGVDTEMKVLCEEPYMEEGYSMIDLLPVTYEDTMLNFANRHCAQCNHFTEHLQLWLPHVKCSTSPEVSSILDIEEAVRLRPDCYILLEPPATVDVNPSRCYSNLVTECNTTGLWLQYNPVMEEACYANLAVYISTDHNSRYYNIFCAICNGEDIKYPDQNICPGFTYYPQIMFTALLAYSLEDKLSDSKITNTNNDHICYASSSYDKITDHCQTVYCSFPLHLDPQSLKCTDGLLGTTVGLISLAVRIRHNMTKSISKIEEFLPNLVPIFENQIMSPICGIHFYSKINVPFTMWKSMLGKERSEIDIHENVIVVEIFKFDMYSWFSPLDVLKSYKALLTFQYESKTDADDFNFQSSIYSSDASALGVGYTAVKTESSVFAMEDPYSGYTFLRHFNIDFDYCDRGLPLFTAGFSECPSFLYDTALFNIERYSKGLFMTSMNATFDFGTFQSKNETHVYVCTDAINQLVKTRSGSNKHGYAYSLVILVFIRIIMVADIWES